MYILLCLQRECCGMDIMEQVRTLTKERICVGPGTLYHLLDQFVSAGMIVETKIEGRKRSYIITAQGLKALENEYQRLLQLTEDYRRLRFGREMP